MSSDLVSDTSTNLTSPNQPDAVMIVVRDTLTNLPTLCAGVDSQHIFARAVLQLLTSDRHRGRLARYEPTKLVPTYYTYKFESCYGRAL